MQLTNNLKAVQIALEEEALGLGIKRYYAEAGRDQSFTGPGQRLLRTAVENMMPALEELIQSLLNGRNN